jgi:hypothetical protein
MTVCVRALSARKHDPHGAALILDSLAASVPPSLLAQAKQALLAV